MVVIYIYMVIKGWEPLMYTLSIDNMELYGNIHSITDICYAMNVAVQLHIIYVYTTPEGDRLRFSYYC